MSIRAVTAFAVVALAGGLLCAAAPASTLAEEGLDPASAEALSKTQQMLRTPSERKAAIEQSKSAQAVDSQVQSIAGSSANADEIYSLSADVMDDLTRESGGDPTKMQQLIEQAQKDPKGFADRMSEKNKKSLRELAGKVPEGQPKTAPAPADADSKAGR